MDIEYLLLLQRLREMTNDLLSPFMMWMSNFAVGFWPIAMICMVYWAFDRKAGKRMIAGFSYGILANGILKLTFRITRPWLRDARVEPYGDSKVTATGYSFPSGHSTWATGMFGGIGLWIRRYRKWLGAIFFTLMILTMFSRNYLGVHTPQDVLIGFSSTALMMWIAAKVEDWTDQEPDRDKIVMAAVLIICALLVILYHSIHIEEVYDAAGRLVVEPAKMVADSFEGIGFLGAYAVCRFFERRKFNFDAEMNWKDRFIIGVFALIPLFFWKQYAFDLIAVYNRSLGRLISCGGMIVYAMIIVPYVMSKIHIPSVNDKQ